MSEVDDAIAAIGRAQSGTGEATKLVYSAIQACEGYAARLGGVGLTRPAAILQSARASLQDKVHVGLAATDGNATQALESLRSAVGNDDLDVVATALSAGRKQLADMRGTAAAATGQLDEASALVARIGSKSRNVRALLGQAHALLDEVAAHGSAAETAADTTSGAIGGDQNFG